MLNLKKVLLLACFSCLISIMFCSCNSIGGEKTLDSSQITRAKHFLHPMPQELRLTGTALQVQASQCCILNNPNASPLTKQMIDDFKARWKAKYGVELLSDGGEVSIVAGVLKNNSTLQKAAKNNVFDAKYLSERPNSEQAYVLANVAENGKSTVYVAANTVKGLYYGFLNLEQLINGLSKDSYLVIPQGKIIDWPDVRQRGCWTTFGGARKKYASRLKEFSRLKFNLIEQWSVYPYKFDENDNILTYWNLPKEAITLGERYAVKLYPGTSHFTHHIKRQPKVKEKYPNIKGKSEKPDAKNLSACQNNPNTQEFLNKYLVSIAKQFDFADIWMTELEGSAGVCHCDKCKGDLRKAFIAETKALMTAYEAAKKVNPKFRIILGLTQGSYPHHLAMLKHIPKEVILNFYHGGMTYRTTFQKYNLPPSAQEMQRLGYTLGSTPSPVPWQIFQPFQTPQYIRQLCGEAEDRGMEFVLSQTWPNPFFWPVNSEALAEFLWNGDGRSAKEFTVAWATRNGLKNPEETAAVIEMLEYPERGMYNCKFKYLLPEVVNFITGKDRATMGSFRGYELKTYAEASRLRTVCEEAVKKAEKLDNPELLAGAKVMRCWMTILERYAYCVKNSKKLVEKDQAIKTIKQELMLYPELFNKWLATKKPSNYAKKNIDKVFGIHWDKALETLKNSALSKEAEKLLEAKRKKDLSIRELEKGWKFKPSSNNVGISGKWFSTDFDSSKWSKIKVGKGYGWEKQGHNGLTGHAWYRLNLAVDAKECAKKHLYLLFNGVDEDAEVFINGKKVLTHDYKTVGGKVGDTWDKPFSFDAKEVLKPGTDNIIAVRVFNRSQMGGIWKPVYLVASDLSAKTADLAAISVK